MIQQEILLQFNIRLNFLFVIQRNNTKVLNLYQKAIVIFQEITIVLLNLSNILLELHSKYFYEDKVNFNQGGEEIILIKENHI